MLDIIKNSPSCNGSSIGGRGLRRRKLTHKQRVGLATDMALGLVRVDLSIKMSAATVGVRPDEVRAELKTRAARGKVEEEIRARKFHQAPTNDAEVSVEEGPTNGGVNDAPLPSSPPPANEGMSFPAWCIVAAWREGSPADQIKAIRKLGTDEVWAALVAAVNADAIAVETADND